MRAPIPRGAAGSALLVVGGYCYVRLPRATWMDRMPVLWSVRSSPHHLVLGLALSTVGLVVLSWAWWDLRAATRGEGAASLSRVRRAAAVWAAPLLLAPPLFSGDGWSYVATGVLTAQGRSPYQWTPAALPVPLRSGVAPVWQFTPSPYGPLPLAWGGALARMARDPWVLLAGYRVAALLGLVLLAWAVPALAAKVGRDPAEASVLVIASPFVLAHGIGGLHNDLAVAALATAALAVTRPGRWLAGALLVGLAAAVKAPGIVAALGVVLLSLPAGAGLFARLARASVVGAVASGVVLLCGWGTGLGNGWFGALSVPDHEYTVLSVSAVTGRMVRSALRHAGPRGVALIHEVHPEIFAKRLGIVALVVVGAWALLRSRLGEPRRVLVVTGEVLLLAVVLSPVVHYWYFLWCVPTLACAPLRAPARSAVVAGITVLGLTAVADPALHVRWLWEGGVWALAAVPAATWALVGSRRPAKSRLTRAGQ